MINLVRERRSVRRYRDKNVDPHLLQQLLAALQRAPKDDLAAMIHFIRKEVTAHAAGAPQSDDITMVALTYRGATKREPGNNG